jgi:hypothetical protein
MEAMFSIIANGWQMRSVERDWEALLREHGARLPEARHLPQSEIIEYRR